MSSQTATRALRKRKSVGDEETSTKKIKVTKSAAKPAPLKSALKKTEKRAVVKEQRPVGDNKSKKQAAKQKTEEEIIAVVDDDEEERGAALTEDQTAALLAGFSSSDEDEPDEDEDAIPQSKIPLAPSTGLIQKRIRQAIEEQHDPELTPGVIYIGRIPHGFYEHQLRGYLSQFGEILNLRLARNKKTGKSQHYAFVEFVSAAVADIVAKTMDKYLLFNHILQVRRVPKEQCKENMFAGSNKRFKKAPPRNKMERSLLKMGTVREGGEKRIEREQQKREKKASLLNEMGYEFEMPKLKPVSDVPVRQKEIQNDGDAQGEAEEVVGAEEEAPVVVKDAVEEAPVVKDVVQTIAAGPDAITVTETKTIRKKSAQDVKPKTTKKEKKKKA